MNRTLFLLAFLFFAETNKVKAQDVYNSASKNPCMAFKDTFYDFGEVMAGVEAEHVFTFRNKGKVPLIINFITMSGHPCYGSNWPRGPIAPGKKGSISIAIRSECIYGKFIRTITIVSSEVERHHIDKLTITGCIVPDLLKRARPEH